MARWYLVSLGLGVTLMLIGHGMGLYVAPPEAMMGDVGRILYVHVPTAWAALVMYLLAFLAAVAFLWTGRRSWDASTVASVEVGILLNALLLIQGSIWAKPTWGIWWTWDPRLTTTAVMVIAFMGVLLLRKLTESPEKKLTLTAVSTIVAFVNVPLVYFSVKWWRTLHQPYSSPETVSSSMVTPLRIAAFGTLFMALGLMGWRRAIAMSEGSEEGPALPDKPAPLNLDEGGEA